jgi:Arc/MetJ family transcription regulator
MTRTNIDIDDNLVAEIMATYELRTKREAVDFALRCARRPKPMEPDEILAFLDEGGFIDPGYDLEAARAARVFEPSGDEQTA